jgi:hypothetical protein
VLVDDIPEQLLFDEIIDVRRMILALEEHEICVVRDPPDAIRTVAYRLSD